MTLGAQFWSERLQLCGHTGWYDPAIYAYDQPERVGIIQAQVQKLRQESTITTALDFGCGVGDVSQMLLGLGLTVYGYDPFVSPKLTNEKFHHVSNLVEISSTVELTVSVTVLDHLLAADELDAALQVIRRHTRGWFVLLEYALNSEADRTDAMRTNPYQAFRTVDQWRGILARHSFKINRLTGVPHPEVCPSPGYLRYRQSLYTKVVRRLLHYHVPVKPVLSILQQQANRAAAPVSIPSAKYDQSPLKLMVCQS